MAKQTPAQALIALGRRFYDRGWVLGTSGNFSVVTSHLPLRLLVTASASHKGMLTRNQFVTINEAGMPVGRTTGRPSAEALLHIAIARARGAGAILHTHSVWGTILSDLHAYDGGLALEGFEMLKGLEGVSTHSHREWVPIVDNDQDMTRLAAAVSEVFEDHPAAHAFLLRNHGLYSWGSSIAEAERHIEVLEFLLETVGRRAMKGQ